MSTATSSPRLADATAAPPRDALAIPADAVAEILSISARTVRRMHSAGLLPRPVRVMGSVRWRVDELRAWLAAGCPDRKTWDGMRKEV
jgi:predicted DNA-binding transcriptional regulator AlpA